MRSISDRSRQEEPLDAESFLAVQVWEAYEEAVLSLDERLQHLPLAFKHMRQTVLL